MCLLGEDDEAAAAALPYCPTHLRCCGHVLCFSCLGVWLGKGGERWPTGYGTGVNGESGAALLTEDPVDTHRCPFCNKLVQSGRHGLVSA